MIIKKFPILVFLLILSACIQPPKITENNKDNQQKISNATEQENNKDAQLTINPLTEDDIAAEKILSSSYQPSTNNQQSQTTQNYYVPTLEELKLGRKTGQGGELNRQRGLEPTIYFEFNQYEVNEKIKSLIQEYVNFMLEKPDIKLILEGHTDERGTSQYNLSLGLKRSYAIQQYIINQGIASDRIESESYGEERPVLEGHQESYWRYNRRVEIYFK